jgi:hypothetical protein
VFFNALNSGGVDGTNWQGHTSGTITTLLNTTASVVPYQIVGNATLSDVSSFVADNLLIPDYIFDNSNSCFYKLTKINDSAFDGAKATLTGSLTLGNNIEIIGAKAFLNKSSLSGPLLIPDSVKQIKNSAFS